MEMFNKDGWTCKRSRKDPCMFLIKKGKVKTWAVIWTDDVDMVGEDQQTLKEIYKMITQKWECKLTDPEYMQRVKRQITREGNELMVELTMTAFIEAMAEAFKPYTLNRKINTPIPDKLFLWRRRDTKDEEKLRVLNKGYQRLFGMLLWAARGTFPECLLGTSILGRMMSAPTDEAWTAAVWMMNYMYQHRNRGIKFSSKGNQEPVVYSDASNKADPTDSKCQYGYTHIWMGGPIIATSRKLSHVGLSAADNEYQALHWANRHTRWLRDLLTEMEQKRLNTRRNVNIR